MLKGRSLEKEVVADLVRRSSCASLSNLCQALLQPLKIRTDLGFHGVLQRERAPVGQFCGGLSVQILLPIPDCLLGGPLGFRRRLMVRRDAGFDR